MHFDVYVALAGLIVGLAVGMTGMGGGALMTPVLVLLFKIQPLAAVSSDLVASLIMRPFGATVHMTAHTVRWPLVRWLVAGSVPSAFLGVVVLRSFGNGHTVQNVVSLALGIVVLVAVAGVLVKMWLDRRRSALPADVADAPLKVRPLPTLAVGAVTGFIVGMTSVGSGTLIVIALLFLYPRLRGSHLIGTDLTQAVPMVGAASLAHILYGDFQMSLTTAIVAGGIPGVLLGSLLSSHVSTRVIRVALSVVLLVTGLKLVNVPTPVIGIALVAATVVALGGMAGMALAQRRRPQRIELRGERHVAEVAGAEVAV